MKYLLIYTNVIDYKLFSNLDDIYEFLKTEDYTDDMDFFEAKDNKFVQLKLTTKTVYSLE